MENDFFSRPNFHNQIGKEIKDSMVGKFAKYTLGRSSIIVFVKGWASYIRDFFFNLT